MNRHEAIYKLYPQVTVIRGDIAYDKDEQEVTYDNNAVEALMVAEEYKEQRAAEYPDFKDYLDGIVKNDKTQINKYIADCQAVKLKYPKPE